MVILSVYNTQNYFILGRDTSGHLISVPPCRTQDGLQMYSYTDWELRPQVSV